jgi:hypothetical protein
MTASIADIVAMLTATPITQIVGEPNRTQILKMIEELGDKAVDVPTTLGGGELGHLGLVLTKEEYEELDAGKGKPYDAPKNPGDYPKIKDMKKVVEEGTLKLYEAKHRASVDTYVTHLGVQKGLKTLIIGAVEETWLLQLKNKKTGYNGVSARGMIDHLLKGAGATLTFIDMKALREQRAEPFDFHNHHVQLYFERQDTIKEELLAGGVKWDDTEMVQTALDHLVECFEDEVLDFQDEKSKKWADCKTYFIQKYANSKLAKRATAKNKGYHSANSVTEATMQAVLEAVATHGAENNEYIQQVAAKQDLLAADLANTKEENAKLKCLLAQLKAGGHGGKSTTEKEFKKCTHCGGRITKKQTEAGCYENPTNAANIPADYVKRAERIKTRKDFQ